MRSCKQCKLTKSIEDFPHDIKNRGKVYIRNVCKECVKENAVAKRVRRVKKEIGQIYVFAESIDSRPVKIGFTTNLEERLKAIESTTGRLIECIWLSENKYTLINEARIHRKLSNFKKIGEWYNLIFSEAVENIKDLL